jgi:hypothetical protein
MGRWRCSAKVSVDCSSRIHVYEDKWFFLTNIMVLILMGLFFITGYFLSAKIKRITKKTDLMFEENSSISNS